MSIDDYTGSERACSGACLSWGHLCPAHEVETGEKRARALAKLRQAMRLRENDNDK